MSTSLQVRPLEPGEKLDKWRVPNPAYLPDLPEIDEATKHGEREVSICIDPCLAKSQFAEQWLVFIQGSRGGWPQGMSINAGGTIVIMTDVDGNYMLAEVDRPVPKRGERIPLPVKPDYFERLGAPMKESPRGYKRDALATAIETGLQEMAEETGIERYLKVIEAGETIPDSSVDPQPRDFLIVICDRQEIARVPELAQANEMIQNAEWVTDDELSKMIADGVIRCGYTMSAKAKIDSLRKHYPDRFVLAT